MLYDNYFCLYLINQNRGAILPHRHFRNFHFAPVILFFACPKKSKSAQGWYALSVKCTHGGYSFTIFWRLPNSPPPLRCVSQTSLTTTLEDMSSPKAPKNCSFIISQVGIEKLYNLVRKNTCHFSRKLRDTNCVAIMFFSFLLSCRRKPVFMNHS